ncbi:MAG: DoxX family protein [Bryobacteraceae bacterium]
MARLSAGSTSTINLALLVLRVWVGLLLFVKHGLDKALNFSRVSAHFADPFHIGPTASLLLVLFAEVVCALLVALGLWTRCAAAVVVINLAVAFGFAHRFQLFGPRSGELAFVFLGAFLTLSISGGGRWSLDGLRGR